MRKIQLSDIRPLFPERKVDSNKGDFGRLLCITGCNRMPGACALSTLSALRSGVGLLTVATTKQNMQILASNLYEAMYLPLEVEENGCISWDKNKIILQKSILKADTILIGCGIGLTENTICLVKNILKYAECPIILDADGLNCIADCINIIKERTKPLILTPHPGEMARLIKKSVKEVQSDRAMCAYEFCDKYDAILVLKGAGTIVQHKKRCLINTTGNPGMSKGGSGDVLAGIIASFSAQGLSPYDASYAGVYIHGLAGDLAAEKFSQQAMLSQDIISCLPAAFKICLKNT